MYSLNIKHSNNKPVTLIQQPCMFNFIIEQSLMYIKAICFLLKEIKQTSI